MHNADLVELFLADLRRQDEERHTLVQRLRKLVLSVDASITEEVKYGGLLFSAGSPFCGVFSYPAHVALEFSRGAAMTDEHGVLEGSGAHRRHIKLLDGADVFKKNVRAYASQAFAATVAGRKRRPTN
jgi:hypothetical protein